MICARRGRITSDVCRAEGWYRAVAPGDQKDRNINFDAR